MPRKRESRIYWRKRGGKSRAYADFRGFADVGGRREPLIPAGARAATVDADIAAELVSVRLRELERKRRNRTLLGVEREATLQAFAAHHLIEKRSAGLVTEGWLGETQKRLQAAVDFFGADTDLAAIHVDSVEEYAAHLRTKDNGRGGTLSIGTQRHYLNALSNLFRRAQAGRFVPSGFNPVASLMDKPSPAPTRNEASWLEVHDAAFFLEAARTYRPRRPHQAQPYKASCPTRVYRDRSGPPLRV